MTRLAAAESELGLAEAMLEEAQEALDGAVIRAPMDGIVALVNIEADDPVGEEFTALQRRSH